jgi:hypothetical protein
MRHPNQFPRLYDTFFFLGRFSGTTLALSHPDPCGDIGMVVEMLVVSLPMHREAVKTQSHPNNKS